jgi:anti-sigma B factor antagonist
MSIPAAKLFVMVGDNYACLKIVGRATFTSSIDFRAVVNELRKKGHTYFVLELSECVLMDSTFLGVLAGIGVQLNNPQASGGRHGVELLNANVRITELLETLGVLHLFKLTQCAPEAADPGEAQPHAPVQASREEITQTCLQAHLTLMAINPENVSKFKDVTQFMAEELRKLQR